MAAAAAADRDAGADMAGVDRDAGADRAGADRAGADRAGADRAGVDLLDDKTRFRGSVADASISSMRASESMPSSCCCDCWCGGDGEVPCCEPLAPWSPLLLLSTEMISSSSSSMCSS